MSRHADHPTRDDIDLVAGAFWGRDPHEEMAWMRANAPVYWDGRVWGISRYADLKAIAKDPVTFSNAGGIRPDSGPIPMMIDMDDPAHLTRRKLVNKGFTPRRVREQEAAVRRACDQIIDAVCERGECDLVTDVAAWLPMIMIGDALGVAPSDRAQLLEWSDALLSALTGDPDDLEGAAAAFGGYTEFALETIADRRANPTDDLMSILVHAEVDGDRLDDDEVLHESLLILIGGDETTRHVISGGMYQLLTHPDQRDRLAADPARLPGAVEEMLRWVSPIKNMARTATRDVEVGGQTIAEGDKLLLLYPSANRDEDVFADAGTFTIDRTPNDHVAFGFGTHFCLGASLARLELTCMVDHLLRRLPDLAVAQDDEPAARPANFVSGYEHLKVTFTPTAPLAR
ncbi:MAG TPA: cytochrome P450 [Iamia sp.]|nr:cytochrome P450 [Iamia sp.]